MSGLRIVLIGSECTGKSTLTCALAKHYRAPYSLEYVRQYLSAKGRGKLTGEDVEWIARAQRDEEDRLLVNEGQRLYLLDTNLLCTWIYSEHYYGNSPSWLEAEFSARRYDYYLLTDTDIPWQDDGQRDRANQREEMQSLFAKALIERELPFSKVSGSEKNRLRDAIRIIDNLLGEGTENK